jgi:tyrosinase
MDGMSFRTNVIDPEQLKAWRATLPDLKKAAQLEAAAIALTAAPVIAPPVATFTRKNQGSLTGDERARFLAAVNGLIASGVWGQMVATHADMSHNMHSMEGPVGSQRFLSWHRDFLSKLEQELQKIDATVSIPYWNWTLDRDIPGWMQNFLPQNIGLPDGSQLSVTRTPGQDASAPDLPLQSDIDNILNIGDYTDFTLALEGAQPFGAHNLVHVWVGGTMNDLMTAPADPIFWMHHANIDRIWSVWQPDHQDQSPTLTGQDAVLDPWNESASDMKNTASLGYDYQPVAAAADAPDQ